VKKIEKEIKLRIDSNYLSENKNLSMLFCVQSIIIISYEEISYVIHLSIEVIKEYCSLSFYF